MKRMPTMPSLLRATNQTTDSTSELQEQIRRRAYELYEQRGRNDGYDLSDWLQAESEMTQRTSNTIAHRTGRTARVMRVVRVAPEFLPAACVGEVRAERPGMPLQVEDVVLA
jgi:hypothetical protein